MKCQPGLTHLHIIVDADANRVLDSQEEDGASGSHPSNNGKDEHEVGANRSPVTAVQGTGAIIGTVVVRRRVCTGKYVNIRICDRTMVEKGCATPL